MTLVALIVPLSVLLYFLAMDALVGGTVVAVNARVRGSLNHRRLLTRLGRALPIAVLASAAFGAAVIAALSARDSAVVPALMTPAGTMDRTSTPRLVHMLLAAVAVTGWLLAEAGLRLRRGEDEVFGRWLARHGAVWMVLTTAANLPAGAWWLVWLPHDTRIRFTGADTSSMMLFSAGLIAAVLALGFGAMSLTVPDPRRYLRATGVTLAVAVVAMVLMREELRPVPTLAPGTSASGWMALAAGLMVCGLYVLWRAARTFLAPPRALGPLGP